MESMKIFVDRHDQDTAKVMGWLEELEVIGEEDEQEEVKEQFQPRTPQRRIAITREEVSPTNTSFSSTSIFDPPYLARREESDDDEICSLTSISPSDTTTFECPIEKLQPDHKPKFTPRPNLAKTLTSILSTESHPPLTRDSDIEHISLRPCLCCTTSSLPCSLTLPICSRCKRNKKTCVFMRKRIPGDRGAASVELCELPVLVRQMESEEEWEGKLRVVEDVRDGEVERAGRENWVLPRMVEREK